MPSSYNRGDEVTNCSKVGVSIDRIMDDIRNDMNGSIKKNLITRKDVLNVQHKLNLNYVEKHSNDHLSVAAWVSEMQEMDYSPILVFKNQGEDQV